VTTPPIPFLHLRIEGGSGFIRSSTTDVGHCWQFLNRRYIHVFLNNWRHIAIPKTLGHSIVMIITFYLHKQVQWYSNTQYNTYTINVREYRRGNQKWTIQKNWQHRVHNTKKNTTQYVLDTTMRNLNKHKQRRHEPYYKQLEVKMNRTSFSCGNRNGHHNTGLTKLKRWATRIPQKKPGVNSGVRDK
jgi:hypothetical protein